jgi:hypothetical protein
MDKNVEANGRKFTIMENPLNAYIEGKRTTMVALVFVPMDEGNAPYVVIQRITAL